MEPVGGPGVRAGRVPAAAAGVWADPPVADRGFEVARVGARASLRTLSDQEWQRAVGAAERMSALASRSGFVYEGGLLEMWSAWELNGLEYRTAGKAHCLESWCRDPHSTGLAFVTFVPGPAGRRGMLLNLMLSTGCGRGGWRACYDGHRAGRE